MKKCMLIIFAALITALFSPVQGEAASLQEIFLFKATAETEKGTYHWEYNSPGNYEYHAKGKALHGEEARRQVEKVYQQAAITPDSTKEELAQAFQKTGVPSINRLDIRWQGPEGELYTWLWKNTD
ncbi:hypothetical protein [Salibacterium aidingense]|uniref:hypothetical protein n=1 Tax=Salibacterium aidingense TaxID=384933 RepID=UPI00042447A1|nr:hypothetical protein [Salibacterium aidingense]